MRKLVWLLLALTLAAMVLPGCGKGSGIYSDPKRVIRARVGEEFVISLTTSASSSVVWTYASTYDWLEMESSSFEVPPQLHPGATLTQQFRFKVLGPGSADLIFEYGLAGTQQTFKLEATT